MKTINISTIIICQQKKIFNIQFSEGKKKKIQLGYQNPVGSSSNFFRPFRTVIGSVR